MFRCRGALSGARTQAFCRDASGGIPRLLQEGVAQDRLAHDS
ncbi:protein of unknown function [Thauera humireducens]|nr:protein of unknown function [Thauera humireducens]